ncbi:MAG: hypothetical protein EPO06_06635 [Burkholderiaceae bacterium]|nr:MAG: hypothetical protein EPO06_06635 [Burkholderiaceae bacterium]
MTNHLLSQDQRETMQEVTNIAMGQAGAKLAQLLGVFIKLSIPQVNLVEMTEINHALAMIVGNDTIVSAVRQAYSGPIRGEAITIFDDRHGHHDLADLLGYDEELTPDTEQELLLDTSNLLVGACVSGIARLLNMDLTFAPPAVLAKGTPIGALLKNNNQDWEYALVVEVNFTLEERRFTCHLTQLMPESSLMVLRESLDLFLASL